MSELQSLLDRIPSLLEELSEDVWQSIEHDDPKSLQAGVAFKQQYNKRAHRLKKAARAFAELMDTHVDVRNGVQNRKSDLAIKSVHQPSQLDRVGEFLTSVHTSKELK